MDSGRAVRGESQRVGRPPGLLALAAVAVLLAAQVAWLEFSFRIPGQQVLSGPRTASARSSPEDPELGAGLLPLSPKHNLERPVPGHPGLTMGDLLWGIYLAENDPSDRLDGSRQAPMAGAVRAWRESAEWLSRTEVEAGRLLSRGRSGAGPGGRPPSDPEVLLQGLEALARDEGGALQGAEARPDSPGRLLETLREALAREREAAAAVAALLGEDEILRNHRILAKQGPTPDDVGPKVWSRDPPPTMARLEELPDRLASIPVEMRWEVVFSLGEEAGRRQIPLASVRQAAEALPKSLRTHLFDGVGHGLDWATLDLDVFLEEVRAEIAEEYRWRFYDGVLRAYTEAHHARPEAVLEFARTFSERLGGYNPRNGIRIGLQRSLGGDLHQAMRVARAYPQDFWEALFEELGWRGGEDEGLKAAALKGLLAEVPPPAADAFIHGYSRGCMERLWTEQQQWDDLLALLQNLDSRQQEVVLSGIAEMLVIYTDPESPALRQSLALIRDPEVRADLEGKTARLLQARPPQTR